MRDGDVEKLGPPQGPSCLTPDDIVVPYYVQTTGQPQATDRNLISDENRVASLRQIATCPALTNDDIWVAIIAGKGSIAWPEIREIMKYFTATRELGNLTVGGVLSHARISGVSANNDFLNRVCFNYDDIPSTLPDPEGSSLAQQIRGELQSLGSRQLVYRASGQRNESAVYEIWTDREEISDKDRSYYIDEAIQDPFRKSPAAGSIFKPGNQWSGTTHAKYLDRLYRERVVPNLAIDEAIKARR